MNKTAETQNINEVFLKYYQEYKVSHGNIFVKHLKLLVPWNFQGVQLKEKLETIDAKLFDDINALMSNGSLTREVIIKYSVVQDAVNGRIEDRIKYFELAAILLAIMVTYIGLIKNMPPVAQVVYGSIITISGALALIARINMMELLAANKTFNIILKSFNG